MRLLVATRSRDKLREIRAILRGTRGLQLVDLNDAGVAPSPEEDRIEVFDTFIDNAVAKARYFRSISGLPTLADDSGLRVDALGGRPGVRSKRFHPDGDALAEGERDRANNEYLLQLLGDLDIAHRTAAYVCVAALDLGEGDPLVFEGEAHGLILGHPRGQGGFGYDPIFFDPPSGKTFAELSRSEKDLRSHRGAAMRKVAAFLVAREVDRA